MRWLPRSGLFGATAAAAAAAASANLLVLRPPDAILDDGVDQVATRLAAPHPSEDSTSATALPPLRYRCLAALAVRREQLGAPGISACVSLRGRRLLSAGVGYADVENLTPCTGRSVMRIASISKSFAAVLTMQLVETARLDIDKPLAEWLSGSEMKKFASVTPRQLLSHTAGVRSYPTSEAPADPEFYSAKHFNSVSESLGMFSADELQFQPGSRMLYSTHGYTLLSAVLEKASPGQRPVTEQFRALFRQLGLADTCLEMHDRITACRARQYQRDSRGRLVNAAYVDNSYKWAGGGLLSCAEDVAAMGEALLRSAEGRDNLLRPDSVRQMWTPVEGTEINWGAGALPPGRYGLGWGLTEHRGQQVVLHTGGSVGGTSVLLLAPQIGVVVCLIANLQDASVTGLAVAMLDAVIDYLRDAGDL